MEAQNYLFVDGGYLRATIRKWVYAYTVDPEADARSEWTNFLDGHGLTEHSAIDWRGLAGVLGGPFRTYLSDAFRDASDAERVREVDRVYVREGTLQTDGRRQKQVDVGLAVDMLTKASRGLIAQATLLAGDSDFVPLVRGVGDTGVQVRVAYFPDSAQTELLNEADIRHRMGLDELWSIVVPALRDEWVRFRREDRRGHAQITDGLHDHQAATLEFEETTAPAVCGVNQSRGELWFRWQVRDNLYETFRLLTPDANRRPILVRGVELETGGKVTGL